MRRTRFAFVFLLWCPTLALAAEPSAAGPPLPMSELKAAAQITRDADGVYHVVANNVDDLFLMQGWAHARDRLFQMDQNRRLASRLASYRDRTR